MMLRWISVQALWQESATDTELHGKEFMCFAEHMLPGVRLWQHFHRSSALNTVLWVLTECGSQGFLMCKECAKCSVNKLVEWFGKKHKIWIRLFNTYTTKEVNSALMSGLIHESVKMRELNGYLCCNKVAFCKFWCSWSQHQKLHCLQVFLAWKTSATLLYSISFNFSLQ